MRTINRLRLVIGGAFLALAAGLLAEPWQPTLAAVCAAITAVLVVVVVPFAVIDERRKRRLQQRAPAPVCRFGCTGPCDPGMTAAQHGLALPAGPVTDEMWKEWL